MELTEHSDSFDSLKSQLTGFDRSLQQVKKQMSRIDEVN